jgi:hypothetical protein
MGYIYLASPYSAKIKMGPKEFHGRPDKLVMEQRYLDVLKATADLMKEGQFIYSPIVHCHELARLHTLPTDYAFWNGYNHCMIEQADQFMILDIPGWLESVGVKGEYDFAYTKGKPIYLLDPKTLICRPVTNPPWKTKK